MITVSFTKGSSTHALGWEIMLSMVQKKLNVHLCSSERSIIHRPRPRRSYPKLEHRWVCTAYIVYWQGEPYMFMLSSNIYFICAYLCLQKFSVSMSLRLSQCGAIPWTEVEFDQHVNEINLSVLRTVWGFVFKIIFSFSK